MNESADDPASSRDSLRSLVAPVNDQLLQEPGQLRQRLEALDWIDTCFPEVHQAVSGTESGPYRRAKEICVRLEAVNFELYESIRSEIQRGAGRDALFRWMRLLSEKVEGTGAAGGMGYDCLDEFISGVLQFEKPSEGQLQRESEIVFYQPTPARQILRLIDLTRLTDTDVFVDLGSGLGHVPLLVSICTAARCVGIELEAGYVEQATQCAERLRLKNVSFISGDARTAELSMGTVFYLYTPFLGSILTQVLSRLKRIAADRQIRICTYGPCTFAVAGESWLDASAAPDSRLITLFRSRD